MHYNWHRHYDPSIGRYTQPDPLGFVDGPSVFAYAGNAPGEVIDPTGLFGPMNPDRSGFKPPQSKPPGTLQKCTMEQHCNGPWGRFAPHCMTEGGGGGGPSSGAGGPPPKFGTNKSEQKWQNQMERRNWTEKQIQEAISGGKSFPAENKIRPENGATRYEHPTTNQSVVIDRATGEIIHLGGPGFKY